MKFRSVLLLALSAALGILAVGLVRAMTPAAPIVNPAEMRKVVVAATALKFGDRLVSGGLRLVDIPPGSVPAGAFATIDELVVPGEPRVVLTTIEPGDLVLANKVSGKGGKASLSTVIDPSMRAVTIRVDDVSGAAGFITPSDRVDLMLTHPDAAEKSSRTDVLLQDVKVLAIDQEANEHTDKPTVAKAVTLEVKPDDAQKIALARTLGTLSLALRNMTTGSAIPTRSISPVDLYGMPKPQRAAKRTIEIIRGAAATTYDLR
jgi:pilus assembly protein CpaB